MSVTEELQKIYDKVDRARNIVCHTTNGCDDCPYHPYEACDFEDIMEDIKDLINVVDPFGMYRNKEKEE